ncbi:MAG: HAD family hydrolase, partial [Chloroflexia bacterium]|nr:HAD family hydrolase [Chloroflexia bacterium]
MIEIINRPSAAPRLAAIDFDGTMSLIRIGWQQVMHG